MCEPDELPWYRMLACLELFFLVSVNKYVFNHDLVSKVCARTVGVFCGVTNGAPAPGTETRPPRTWSPGPGRLRTGGNAAAALVQEENPWWRACLRTRCFFTWRTHNHNTFHIFTRGDDVACGEWMLRYVCSRFSMYLKNSSFDWSALLPQVLLLLQCAEPPILCSRQKLSRPYTEVTMMTLLTSMADKELVHMITWAKKLPGTDQTVNSALHTHFILSM